MCKEQSPSIINQIVLILSWVCFPKFEKQPTNQSFVDGFENIIFIMY